LNIIIDAIKGQVATLSVNESGYTVIQWLLERTLQRSNEERILLKQVMRNAARLANDARGSRVIQTIFKIAVNRMNSQTLRLMVASSKQQDHAVLFSSMASALSTNEFGPGIIAALCHSKYKGEIIHEILAGMPSENQLDGTIDLNREQAMGGQNKSDGWGDLVSKLSHMNIFPRSFK